MTKCFFFRPTSKCLKSIIFFIPKKQNKNQFDQDRKRLLQQWVASNGDASKMEAELVLSKSQSKKQEGTKELLTTAEMSARGIPLEKIRAVVAKGQGIPDSDCPELPSLTRFWVSTSVKIVDTDETSQQSQVRIQADPAAAINQVFSPMPELQAGTAKLGADQMQAMLQNLGTASTPAASNATGGAGPFFRFFVDQVSECIDICLS